MPLIKITHEQGISKQLTFDNPPVLQAYRDVGSHELRQRKTHWSLAPRPYPQKM